MPPSVLPKIELTNEPFEVLQLRHTDNKKTVAAFMVRIRSYGFGLAERVNRGLGKIQRVHMNISYYQGLDWKLKLRNFEVLEIKILLDKNKNPIGLAYRLSETGKFSETIALNSRARSSHKFSKIRSKGNHTFTKHIKQRN